MKISHAANRRRWRSSLIDDPDAKLFSLPIQMQKKGRTRHKWPVESAAAEEIENRWPSALFLDDFHKRLGKHKTLSTLTTGPATTIHLQPSSRGTKTSLPVFN
jgi:hypothetical protein